ncbi:hypothetical protein LPJ61_000141 [Coemansia biformis]|uniref:Uncharacterized protein n=1 Tax=Coemansia biformis TaxID=1286918 RepID=A0A9W7YJA0_9FUNG|nr:hypothetical protein LPJ61_000141 [Coemansia biformis]
MVQMGIRNNSRNSMVVGDMLFPGIGSNDRGLALPAEKKALPKSTRYTMDAELAADIGTRRESRYLYDVPGSSLGGSVHGTISRALQWSQRISHGPPRQLHRTRSSIVDQHKIYDIYEESIWHTARTPIALPSAATDAKTGVSRFHFGLGGSSALESLRSGFGNKSAPTGGATGNPHTNVLRSVKSASAPWNMIRSWKNRDSSSRKRTEWDLSSVSTESSYSEVDGCSTLSDSECQDDRSHQHKHSAIHLLVKRAGHGLMRRSASFYRSISGTTLASSASGGESKAEHTRPSSSSDSRGPVLSPANASGARRAIGRRLASAMRLAGGKLRGTWRPSSASLAPSEDDSDIVSAYPADPSAEEALDSYLSMSAIHSPVLPSVASANTGKATAVATATTAYVPPKRPPYLGLHRKSVVERDLDAASQADPVQQHMGVARARSTQFKSPFTTLPYGAYHQAK